MSIAGNQLGKNDDRDLFPEALRLVKEIQAKAIILENVRGFLGSVFEDYRLDLKKQLEKLDYNVDWRLLNVSDYRVAQLRPRVIIIAFKKDMQIDFEWPQPFLHNLLSVGTLLEDLMNENNWCGINDLDKERG